LDDPSSTPASELAYDVASDCSAACLAASESDGTVETMFARISYAAVATAASVEAVAPNRRPSRYGR
jgi:hypothetical protein